MKPVYKTVLILTLILVSATASWILYQHYVGSETESVTLLVYTPPSIQPLLEEAARSYMQANPHVKINIVGGATGTLLNKISLTGEGDIFITADHEYMVNASRKGLVRNETIRVVSFLVIALITPKGNPANITGLQDLVSKNIKIGIANPQVAPFGRMAIALLQKNGIYEKVKDKLVVYGDVGQTAKQVALGLVDVAILPHIVYYWYRNDTSIIWLNSSQLPKVSCQMVAVLNTTKNYAEAVRFEEFLVEYARTSSYASENGYVGSIDKIPVYTPYSVGELSFEDICMEAGR